MVSSALTIINIVLTLLNTFVEWGKRSKIFKEDEALIAASILTRSLKEIEVAKQIKEDITRKFDSDPSSILQPDEFTRPTKDK